MKFSEETWSNDDHSVDLVKAEEDGLVYVDHARQDVKEGTYLIPSGSDTVGFYSVDADQLKKDGFKPDTSRTRRQSPRRVDES